MIDLRLVARKIHAAIRDNNPNLAVELLEKNKELGILHYKTPFGTWLHDATTYGHHELIRYLVVAGIDINEKGGVIGGNALNCAISEQDINIVKYFLDNRADMDTSRSESNPLFTAIYRGNMELVKLLIDCGIDYRVTYSGEYAENMDAEAYALERGQVKIAEYLKSLK